MNHYYKLSREENGEDIGFVIACLYSGLIEFYEFKDWLDFVIKNSEVKNLPNYIWDLIDLEKEEISDLYVIIGFVPVTKLSQSESNSLIGIALRRFPYLPDEYDLSISSNNALKCLKATPHILQKVKEMFYFIDDLQRIELGEN